MLDHYEHMLDNLDNMATPTTPFDHEDVQVAYWTAFEPNVLPPCGCGSTTCIESCPYEVS
jgi:hypothetical protein